MREKLNRNQLGEEFCVDLATVSHWINHGCPVLERKGREVFFDPIRVLMWHEAREASGSELAKKTRAEIVQHLEAAHAQAFLWMHCDAVRFENADIRKGIRTILEGIELVRCS